MDVNATTDASLPILPTLVDDGDRGHAIFEQVQRQQDRAVVVANTQATADFLTATLAVHGISASHHAYSQVYPSVDWVQGYRVMVAAADEAEARAVLGALSGRDGAAVLPEDEVT